MRKINSIDILDLKEGDIFHFDDDHFKFSAVIIDKPGKGAVYNNYIICHVLSFCSNTAKCYIDINGTHYIDYAFNFCEKTDFDHERLKINPIFPDTPFRKCLFIDKSKLPAASAIYLSDSEEEKLLDQMRSFYVKTSL